MKWMFVSMFSVLIACTHQQSQVDGAPQEELVQKDEAMQIGQDTTVVNPTRSQTLTFIDSNAFDSMLSNHLRENTGSVIIEVVDVDVNNVPSRLDKWLSIIARSQGHIEMVPAADFPVGGFSVQTLTLAYKAYDFGRNQMLYRPAKGYNAQVEYVPGDGLMRSIILTPKNATN